MKRYAWRLPALDAAVLESNEGAGQVILPDGYSDVPAGKIATVVTHLEMTQRPPLPQGAMGPWTLRKVERPDLAWYRDLYRRVGEEWLWYSRIRMADDKLEARLHHPLVETHALLMAGRDEGLLELDFRESNTCEIGMFGVTAMLVGTGAGRWLMNRALELAWARPVNRVWLHTCTFDHPAALPFYQRAGFRPFRRQVEIDDDPRLDGTAPRHIAKHVPIIEQSCWSARADAPVDRPVIQETTALGAAYLAGAAGWRLSGAFEICRQLAARAPLQACHECRHARAQTEGLGARREGRAGER